jgi:hypothetical protein
MLGRIVSNLVSAVIAVIVIWGEVVGTVHAFRQHGTGDGWAALAVPPFAIWRGIEYFLHSASTSASSTTVSDVPLNAEEMKAVTAVYGKAMHTELTDDDIASLESTLLSYAKRSGRKLTTTDVEAFTRTMDMNYRYNRELAQCLLMSLHARSPHISSDLEKLASEMKGAGAREEKLDSDRRMLISAATGDTYTDQFGTRRRAPGIAEVEAGLENLKLVERNMNRVRAAFLSTSSR